MEGREGASSKGGRDVVAVNTSSYLFAHCKKACQLQSHQCCVCVCSPPL